MTRLISFSVLFHRGKLCDAVTEDLTAENSKSIQFRSKDAKFTCPMMKREFC